jgi:hypothetical protein
MNPEIKQKWVAALRSGDYEQGKRRLYEDGLYCYLGVLCDVYRKETGDGEFRPGLHNSWSFVARHDIDGATLPYAVSDWAVISFQGDDVEIAGYTTTLTEHNDSGRTFAEIADAIEAQL